MGPEIVIPGSRQTLVNLPRLYHHFWSGSCTAILCPSGRCPGAVNTVVPPLPRIRGVTVHVSILSLACPLQSPASVLGAALTTLSQSTMSFTTGNHRAMGIEFMQVRTSSGNAWVLHCSSVVECCDKGL